jgi:hypothetical protein
MTKKNKTIIDNNFRDTLLFYAILGVCIVPVITLIVAIVLVIFTYDFVSYQQLCYDFLPTAILILIIFSLVRFYPPTD